MPNTKLFDGLFCLYLEIFQERGGGYLVPKLLKNFLLECGHFSGRGGGGLPDFKDDEVFFVCFGLDIFQGKWGKMTKIQTL